MARLVTVSPTCTMTDIAVHVSQTHGHLLTPTLFIPLYTAMLTSITLTPVGLIGSYRPYPVVSTPLKRTTAYFWFGTTSGKPHIDPHP
jgi:hypothetical protein